MATTTHFPRTSGYTPRSKNSTSLSTRDNEGKLPELRSSQTKIDKTKPLPTSLQSEFIPDEILLAITQPPPSYDKLGPPSRYRNLDTSVGVTKKKPAGVWTHIKSRDRFKHLTENTPCVCGAGRDVSFLYDVPIEKEKRQKPDQFDPTEVRKDEELEEQRPKKKAIRLPDTLIPDEYHIVKNKGVMGLEYYEDSFGTHPTDHEAHLVLFPSMHPASRYEVVQLKKTLLDMLSHAGLDDDDFQLEGPTQMHNLLEVIRKEQDIYNVVFHELIRQVSVECVERGELLSEVRNRYSQLVNKIPRQIKGLHEEVLAQRALDRRLTEELMRFKNTISYLTSELSAVKEHDRQVTAEAETAQAELKHALAESRKNASLLSEYHDLYELQRKRLEKHVINLTDEKEIWSTAAYSLALKVTDEHSLNTAKRLHISEKSWAKLANHFSILLSDQDTEVLTQLQGHVDKWRELLHDFHTQLRNREDHMREQVRIVRSGIQHWINYFQRNVLSSEGHFQKPPEPRKITQLYDDLKKFQEMLATQNELFGGDVLLSGQELLFEIGYAVNQWTDCAVVMFTRHRDNQDNNHPDHNTMLEINNLIEGMIAQFRVRLNGENGSSTGIIQTLNTMELWDVKFTSLLHGNNPLPEQEWLRFYTSLDDWMQFLEKTLDCIGSTQKEDEKVHIETIEMSDVTRAVHKWLSSTTTSIDSEDAKLVEEVTSLHTEMIKWMVQLLLRLAPDREDHSQEARDSILLGSATIAEIEKSGLELFKRIDEFTQYLCKCCSDIVHSAMQKKLSLHEDDADAEYKELIRFKSESNEWVATAKILLSELLVKCSSQVLTAPQSEQLAPPAELVPEKPVHAPVSDSQVVYHDQEKLTPPKPQERPPPMGGQNLTASGTETMEVIDHAENTRATTIGTAKRDTDPNAKTPTVADAPDTKRAFEALAAVSGLQEQILQTEERAIESETRKSELEAEVKQQSEKIRALERQIAELESFRSSTSQVGKSTSDVKHSSSRPSASASGKTRPSSPEPVSSGGSGVGGKPEKRSSPRSSSRSGRKRSGTKK